MAGRATHSTSEAAGGSTQAEALGKLWRSGAMPETTPLIGQETWQGEDGEHLQTQE